MRKNIPTAQRAIRDLMSILPVIHSAIEVGTREAREYFEAKAPDGAVDFTLAPHLVRYHAKTYLKARGHDVKEENEPAFDLNRIPNNGLSLRFSGYTVRILKSDDGRLPLPGNSESRRDFYKQIPLAFPGDIESDSGSEHQANLVLLWNISPTYAFQSLTLVCPKNAADSREDLQVYWQEVLPHPAETIRADVPEIQPGDLPLALKKDKDESAGAA